MNCEEFRDWLDAGMPADHGRAPLVMDDHAASCPACAADRRRQEQALERLSAPMLSGPAMTRLRNQAAAAARTAAAREAPTGSPGPVGLVPWSFAALALAGCGLLVAGLLLFPRSPTPSPEVPRHVAVGPGAERAQMVLLAAGEKFVHNGPDGCQIEMTGPLTGTLAQDLAIQKGSARIAFRGRFPGFRVRVPYASLGIRGTVIQVVVQPGGDHVWVERGLIAWEHGPTGRTGELGPGSGATFSPAGVQTLTSAPLAFAPAPASETSGVVMPILPDPDLDGPDDDASRRDRGPD